jgi:hypothetical protein
VTEAEWVNEHRPRFLVEYLRQRRSVRSDRKLRLFAVACARQLWPLLNDGRCRRAIETAERVADGNAGEVEQREAAVGARASTDYRQSVAGFCASLTVATYPGYSAYYAASVGNDPVQCEFLRDIFGNLFRPVTINPDWLRWNAGVVEHLARAAYEERTLPSGELDRQRLGILADALEDAGCTDPDILNHLRGPGVHVRGCWVIDLLLGKG